MGFKLTKKKMTRRKRNKVVMHLNNFLRYLNAYKSIQPFAGYFELLKSSATERGLGTSSLFFHGLTWLKQDLLMVIKLQRKWWNL